MAHFKEKTRRWIDLSWIPWHYVIVVAAVSLITHSAYRLGMFGTDAVARSMMFLGLSGLICVWVNIGLAGVNLDLTFELPAVRRRDEVKADDAS